MGSVPNVVPRLTETPGGLDWLGPPLGAHNQEILGDLLGIDAARLAELKDKGVI